jgi:hypothetical protein
MIYTIFSRVHAYLSTNEYINITRERISSAEKLSLSGSRFTSVGKVCFPDENV